MLLGQVSGLRVLNPRQRLTDSKRSTTEARNVFNARPAKDRAFVRQPNVLRKRKRRERLVFGFPFLVCCGGVFKSISMFDRVYWW